MRKFASLVAAGAMLLSSTAAFAADEGALTAGGAAQVRQAQEEGWSTGTIVITVAVIATIITIVAVESNSSNHT